LKLCLCVCLYFFFFFEGTVTGESYMQMLQGMWYLAYRYKLTTQKTCVSCMMEHLDILQICAFLNKTFLSEAFGWSDSY